MPDHYKEHVELLRRAVADPFAETRRDDPPVLESEPTQFNMDLGEKARESAIAKWFVVVQQQIPLWCFDKWTFRELQPEEAASSHPLRSIIRVIQEDESPYFASLDESSPLPSNIWVRRLGLTDLTNPSGVGTWRKDGERRIPTGTTGTIDSIGLFEVDLGEYERTRRSGRPAEGAPTKMRQLLYADGEWFFRVCRGVLVGGTSGATSTVLTELGLPAEEHYMWGLRLALPMLSWVEIDAMLIDHAAGLTKEDQWPGGFAVCSVAHRLRVDPRTVADGLESRVHVSWVKNHPDSIETALKRRPQRA